MTVEVIDLTISSPPLIIEDDNPDVQDAVNTVSNDTQKEKKKKKPRPRRTRGEDWEDDDQWKHDKFSDEERQRQGEKRKWEGGGDDPRSHKRRERSPSLLIFTIDTAPSAIAGAHILSATPVDVVDVEPSPVVEPGSSRQSLLLPAHVVVSTEELASVPHDTRSLSPVSEASGIDFLDDDRAVGAPRYFDDRATNPKTPRFRAPCKRCGDDDHEVKNCPNMICFTCGARNEHNPRSCPILRFCWNCKGKGHISRDCPRIGTIDPQRLDREDCERCGSWKHHGTNCPTIWRIYTYLTDGERDAVLADREHKRQLGFDEGGEGYIARDQWCYNCGGSGHFGDDCEVVAPNHDRPNDYSAFGSYNQLTGPFADPSYIAPDVQRDPREWEQGDRFDDGYGFSAENNVGRKGRENAKAKAREAQRLLEADDDEPDWFNKNRAASANGKGRAALPSQPLNGRGRGGLPNKPLPPTIHFGPHNLGSSKPPWDSAAAQSGRPPTAPRSLRDRIDMGDGQTPREPRRDRSEKKSRDRRRDSGERRGKDARRDGGERRSGGSDRSKGRDDSQWPRDEPRRERGSRWRGGYDR